MKSPTLFLLAAALLAGGCQSNSASTSPTATGNVAVNFQKPDSFTDARDSAGVGFSQYYLDILSKHLKEISAPRLAAGQTLTVTVTDIDLAGDIPPGQLGDVRIIKAIYIPRMTLTFQLKDASGATVKEGERRLSDINFQMKINPILDRNEPLNYDKQMLTDWVRQEFKS